MSNTNGRFGTRRVAMTLAEARATLSAISISLRKSDGEYRVNFVGGREGTAYYTNDIGDAVSTGKLMAKRHDKDEDYDFPYCSKCGPGTHRTMDCDA